jgi:arylsulfatase A
MIKNKIRKLNSAVLGAAMTSLLAVAASAAEPQKDQTSNASPARTLPNIIFILADDLGYADVSCYGAEKIQTPNIDRIAKEGIRFTDGHAGASTCTPTRYAFMTGRYNFRSWLKYSALSTSAPLLIEEDRVTVASFLKSAGYATSLVGKWHLGYGHEEGFEDNRGDTSPNSWETRGDGPDWNGELRPGPQENGFDYSYVVPVANSFPPYVFVENDRVVGLTKESPIGKLESRNHGKMEGGEGARWTDEELIDKFADKLNSELDRLAKKDQPFFLYYTPTHPHIGSRVLRSKRQAHWPHERFAGTSKAGPFGDVIHELDWSVGVILEKLKNLGIEDNTLVIFTSDNGGYPRQFNGHYPMGPILRGGKGDLVEGGTRVPFVAKWPGKIPAGTVSKEIVSTTDMMATFAAIVEEKLPQGAGPDSYNVLPALLGDALPDPERPIVFISGGTGAHSLRAGKWKLIEGQGNRGYGEFRSKKPVPHAKPGDPPSQLYNLDVDLGEANNLYAQHPEIARRLEKALNKIRNAKH